MEQIEKADEPPSCLRAAIFVIGRDSNSNWVAQELNGMRGGLFVDRARAVKFVRSECGRDQHAIVWVSGVLELDLSAAASAPRPADSPLRKRHAA